MSRAMKTIADLGIIPVISITKAEYAASLAKALCEGGLPIIEVTLRSDAAVKAIRVIHEEVPDCVVGAGTVLTTAQIDQVKEAGAEFIVTPGFDPALVEYAQSYNLPIVPGCVTASDIQIGISMGLSVFKFFPAENMGGLPAIQALSAPFSGVKFIPTGGISFKNLSSYLQDDRILACGGSFMAKAHLIDQGDWDSIRDNCRLALDASLGFELAHVGINHPDEESALKTANSIATLFRQTVKDGESSAFAGTVVECMKMMFRGKNGHIGFYTNSVERAEAYFRARNIPLIPESFRRDEKNKLVSFYLQDQIGGFSVHVVRRK